MKSERGVTLTSIMVYVVALTSVVILIGRITTYFYKNIEVVSSGTNATAEYTKFNSYFTNEINIKGNNIYLCENDCIIFLKSRNQYTFQGNAIYMNKIKICKDVESCEFQYDENTKVITVKMVINDKEYNTKYTVFE